jgi:hypothetical protein
MLDALTLVQLHGFGHKGCVEGEEVAVEKFGKVSGDRVALLKAALEALAEGFHVGHLFEATFHTQKRC